MLQSWWSNLTAETQLNLKRLTVGTAVVSALLLAYYGSGQDAKEPPRKENKTNLSIGTDMLEDDIRTQVNQDLAQQTEVLNEQNKRLKDMEALMASLQKIPATEAKKEAEKTEAPQKDDHFDLESIGQLASPAAGQNYPPPPQNSVYASPTALHEPIALETKVIGGISRSKGAAPPSPKEESAAKKKKTVYMPPSFMDAKLLIGLNALTSEGGQSNPEPIVFRVQAPAVLPNNLKANLKGCFVVANAHGNLAQERVQGQLVSLNCMGMGGEAVIDQKIEGFVADADGKRGLTGNIVTRAGAYISRTMIAGVFGGIGYGLNANSVNTSISPLGATQVIDPEKALQSGVGEGIKSGADALQKLFLEYAKQSGPVIEVGAAKDATLFIQEGVTLEIKEKGES